MHGTGPPILLTDVLDDVGAVVKLLAQGAPYPALGGWYSPGSDPHARTRPLWFRSDWVNETLAVTGSELFFHHPGYMECARAYYGTKMVEPHSVYVNLMMAMPIAGPAHTDNPRFAGRDQSNTPMWVLRAMLESGLFDDVAFPQATAIWWLNDVEGGGIRYWPYGPDQPPVEHADKMANTALMGNTHGMFHQVNAIGPFDIGKPQITPMAQLAPADRPDGEWVVIDHGEEVYRSPLADIRVSVQWKADVYFNADHRTRLVSSPLGLNDVAVRFNADLADRGIDLVFDVDRIHDPDHAAEISQHYPEARPIDSLPAVFDY